MLILTFILKVQIVIKLPRLIFHLDIILFKTYVLTYCIPVIQGFIFN